MFDGPAEGCSADRADGRVRAMLAAVLLLPAWSVRRLTKWKLMKKAEWLANNASMFDASPFGYDKERRAAFLRVAEEFFDQESQNSWDGQFTESGRRSTDDGKARSQYFREVEILKKKLENC